MVISGTDTVHTKAVGNIVNRIEKVTQEQKKNIIPEIKERVSPSDIIHG